MTDLRTYLEAAERNEVVHVDWSAHPWNAAYPVLHWLRMAPPLTPAPRGAPLPAADVMLICDYMARRFMDDAGQLIWSSYMLETALDAAATSLGGPPEPLLRSLWNLLSTQELDRLCYEFCRAFGGALLGGFRGRPEWDLGWMLGEASASQACFRCWTLGVRPELWSEDVEKRTMDVLSGYPFQF